MAAAEKDTDLPYELTIRVSVMDLDKAAELMGLVTEDCGYSAISRVEEMVVARKWRPDGD